MQVTDRGSSWLGPAIVALIQQLTGSIRPAFFYILVVLALPLPLLFTLDVEAGIAEAAAFSRMETTAMLRSARAAGDTRLGVEMKARAGRPDVFLSSDQVALQQRAAAES